MSSNLPVNIANSEKAAPRTHLVKYIDKVAKSIVPSRKEAINANCQVCVGGDIEVGWRERIRSCEVIGCHLYPWRPYR